MMVLKNICYLGFRDPLMLFHSCQRANFNPCPAEPEDALPLTYENGVDPDQMGSEESTWSGSVLFVIQFVDLYEQTALSCLIGWQ